MPLVKRWFVEKLVKSSRDALVLRERSKSHAVRCYRKVRPAYLDIAKKLVDAKALPDTDLLFFFTHEEIGRFLDEQDPTFVRRALHRRRLFAQQMLLEFPRVSVGKPIPVSQSFDDLEAVDVMQGTPVSRGVVVGFARVARSPQEAKAIERTWRDPGRSLYGRWLGALFLACCWFGFRNWRHIVARRCRCPRMRIARNRQFASGHKAISDWR